MVTLDCPWCDGPMALEADAVDASCDGCSVRVEIAPDPVAGRDGSSRLRDDRIAAGVTRSATP